MTVRLAPNSFSVSERLAAIFYCNVNVKIREYYGFPVHFCLYSVTYAGLA